MQFRGKRQVKPPERIKKPSLLEARGVQVGKSIVWGESNVCNELTEIEIEAIKKHTGRKTVNYVRALAIKSLMQSKTCAQIVRHFKGRQGYSERTIKGIHAALSKAGVGAKQTFGATVPNFDLTI